MKAILIMFDSLNRRFLGCYGGSDTPNFDRLAKTATQYDNFHIASMCCMPARRELHTGRYNFLHRGWGPLEPYDDSMPLLLAQHGIHTHLVTDHYHYWEEGGGNYHTKYTTYQMVRGQEGDAWKAVVGGVAPPENLSMRQIPTPGSQREKLQSQDWINRLYMETPEKLSQYRVFDGGLEFLEHNHKADGWFLQIETFDPHEPFYFAAEHDCSEPLLDWPEAGRPEYSDEETNQIRRRYKALLSHCDKNLGRVLDAMDRYDLWQDTLLIVATDHGLLLGERGWWSKTLTPFYNEIAKLPFFLHNPRSPAAETCNNGLFQTIDIAPTLLDWFETPAPKDMRGKSLLSPDNKGAEGVLFGMHNQYLNYTDGKYTYMRAPLSQENDWEYTLMPAHMRRSFSPDYLAQATLSRPFSFTKGCPLLRVPYSDRKMSGDTPNLLFDLEADPGQEHPIHNEALECEICRRMYQLLRENDAPEEQYALYAL